MLHANRHAGKTPNERFSISPLRSPWVWLWLNEQKIQKKKSQRKGWELGAVYQYAISWGAWPAAAAAAAMWHVSMCASLYLCIYLLVVTVTQQEDETCSRPERRTRIIVRRPEEEDSQSEWEREPRTPRGIFIFQTFVAIANLYTIYIRKSGLN